LPFRTKAAEVDGFSLQTGVVEVGVLAVAAVGDRVG